MGLKIRELVLVGGVFIFVVILISVSFFSPGKLISNSEESLNLFNSQRAAKLYSSAWYEMDLGKRNPFNFNKYPTFLALSSFDIWQVPPASKQVILIVFFMLSGLIGAYLLSRLAFKFEVFPSLIFALFYLLNLYTISQVWRRMLYSGMAGWAYFPIFLLLWIKVIETQNIRWLMMFAVSSIFFAIAFSLPSNLLTFWVPALIFVLVQVIKNRKQKKQVGKIILTSGVAFLLWCICNWWWLNQIIKTSTGYVSSLQLLQGSSSYELLKGVSNSFPTQEIILLRQAWWFGESNHWYPLYSNPLVYLISILVLGLGIFGWKEFRGRTYWGYLTLLIFLGWFVSKGTNPPFGEVFFEKLFNMIHFTGALRNSYEKFGLVFLLPYAAFFSFGLHQLTQKVSYKLRWKSRALVILLVLGVLVWPMWSGGIFLKGEYVEVPEKYQSANDYLNSVGTERILHLPYLEFGNVKYAWGYNGQNPNEYLYDRQSISNKIHIELFDEYIKQAEKVADHKDYLRIMGLMGVQEIIVHSDIVEGGLQKRELVESRLKNWVGLENQKDFENMTVYSVDDTLVKTRVYIATNIKWVNSLEDGFEKLTEGELSEFFYEDLQGGKLVGDLRMSFEKQANDYYLARVEDVEEDFVLVLNNLFESGWKAVIEGKEVEKHFLVNGLMNGWLIQKRGDLVIEIKFDP